MQALRDDKFKAINNSSDISHDCYANALALRTRL